MNFNLMWGLKELCKDKKCQKVLFFLFYPCFLTPFHGIWNLFKCCLLESNFILQYSNICSYPTILIDTRLNPNCMQNPKKPNPQLSKDTQKKTPRRTIITQKPHTSSKNSKKENQFQICFLQSINQIK